MPPFPWDSLKAETLRSICKDIGANSGTKKNRENMVTFLKEVEIRGLSSALQNCESTEKVVPTTKPPPVNNDTAPEPVTKLPSHDQCEDSNDMDSDMGSDDMDTGDCPDSVSKPCPCANGWLSPRMKFILSTVAAVASDLILDTGEMAAEFGHVGAVHMTQYIPQEELPKGKKVVGSWIEGFSIIFREVHKMFNVGRIPTEGALLETLDKLPKSERKLIDAYAKHTELEHALAGLVQQAKTEWKEDFQDIHCDKKWDKLVTCTKHDFNWTLAEDMLAG